MFLIKKNACFLLQCFSEIYTYIFNHNSLIIFQLQTITTSSSKKKGKEKVNDITVSLIAIKIPKAQLCYLPLGFSTLYKPDPLCYYNSSNCSNFSSINIDLIKILSCDHTYHISCYNNNGLKCLHCLLFLQNDINEYVKFLLKHL